MRKLSEIFAPIGTFIDNLTKVTNSKTTRSLKGVKDVDGYSYYLRATPSGSLSLVLQNETLLSSIAYSGLHVPAYSLEYVLPLEDKIHIHNLGHEEAKTIIARFDNGENLNKLLTMIREGKSSLLDQILEMEDKKTRDELAAQKEARKKSNSPPAPHA